MATSATKKATDKQPSRGDDPRGAPTAQVTPATPDPDPEVKPRKKRVDLVSVTVSRGFRLTHDDSTFTDYAPGIQDMPREHAEHWYAKAHDVEINED